MCALVPECKNYKDWFAQLLTEIKKLIADEYEPEDYERKRGTNKIPEIHGIKFDARSMQGFETIRRIFKANLTLNTVIFSSVWLLILVDPAKGLGRPADIAYNVTNSEWTAWKAALAATKKANAILLYRKRS